MQELQRQVYSSQVMIDKSVAVIQSCENDNKANVESTAMLLKNLMPNEDNQTCRRDFYDITEKVHKLALDNYDLNETIMSSKNKVMLLQQQAHKVVNRPV